MSDILTSDEWEAALALIIDYLDDDTPHAEAMVDRGDRLLRAHDAALRAEVERLAAQNVALRDKVLQCIMLLPEPHRAAAAKDIP